MKTQNPAAVTGPNNGHASLPPPRAMTVAVFGRVLDTTSQRKLEFINLTSRVEQVVHDSGILEGMVLVQSLHTTTAILINEWQDALLDDFRTLIEGIVPSGAAWQHNDPRRSDCERSNAASHLRALLLGSSAILQVRTGRLVRGA